MSLFWMCVQANWIETNNSVSKRKENLLSKMLDLMLNLEFVTIFFLFRLLVEFVMCIFAFRKRNKSTKE